MKVTTYICARWSRYNKEWEYRTFSYNPNDNDYVLIEEREIDFESLSDRELKKQLAAGLRAQKQQVIADAQVECNEIDQRIQELLALEDHSGEAS